MVLLDRLVLLERREIMELRESWVQQDYQATQDHKGSQVPRVIQVNKDPQDLQEVKGQLGQWVSQGNLEHKDLPGSLAPQDQLGRLVRRVPLEIMVHQVHRVQPDQLVQKDLLEARDLQAALEQLGLLEVREQPEPLEE